MGSLWTVHGMLEVMDVVDTGRRRRFSVGEKVRIVEESLSGQNLARATARRYGIALSGLYLWRRQYQRGELGGLAPRFRPVEFLPETSAAAALAAPDGGDKIEVVLLNGRKLVVPTAVGPDVLARFIAMAERA